MQSAIPFPEAWFPPPSTTPGEVKLLTGESFVPVLLLDDGTVIKESGEIVAWAAANPAGAVA